MAIGSYNQHRMTEKSGDGLHAGRANIGILIGKLPANPLKIKFCCVLDTKNMR